MPKRCYLCEGILRGLNKAGIYGEDATADMVSILKDMGRYDFLPPCFMEELDKHSAYHPGWDIDSLNASKLQELLKRKEEAEKELANFGDARSIADNIRLQCSRMEKNINDCFVDQNNIKHHWEV